MLGICLFERTWKNVERFRNPPSAELDELFPAFRRRDAVNWRKWKFYPGAMFLLFPRMILFLLISIISYLLVKILMVCHDPQKPIKGCRKFLINGLYYIVARLIAVFVFFTWSTYKYLDEKECDYSEYLGTNEIQPVDSSLGRLMKDFYSRTNEHSSRLIREQSGLNFVSMGSQLLDEKDKLYVSLQKSERNDTP